MIWVPLANRGRNRANAVGHLLSAAFSHSQRIMTGNATTPQVWNIVELGLAGRELIEMVCREKLLGANHLTAGDVDTAPVLLIGEDVCGRRTGRWRVVALWPSP